MALIAHARTGTFDLVIDDVARGHLSYSLPDAYARGVIQRTPEYQDVLRERR